MKNLEIDNIFFFLSKLANARVFNTDYTFSFQILEIAGFSWKP